MNCYTCPEFNIVSEPIKAIDGGCLDMGLAECKKHGLVVDFLDHRKLKKLTYIEEEAQHGSD